jgi:hypothetical protein
MSREGVSTSRGQSAPSSARVAVACALVCNACGAEPPRAVVTSVRPPPPAAPELPDYAPNPSASLATFDLGAGRRGLLLGELRYVLGAGPEAVQASPGPPLRGAVSLPAHLGGGFAFWSGPRLLRASDFLGELRPIVALRDTIQSVEVHPRGLLVSTPSSRHLLDPSSGAVQPIRPVGLLSVATAPDGRALALLDLGGAAVSIDRGTTWTPISNVGEEATGVRVEGSKLFLEAGSTFELDDKGAAGLVVASRSPPPTEPDPRWREPVSPLAAYGARGLPLSGLASPKGWVHSRGALYELDLPTGAIADVIRDVGTADRTCSLVLVPSHRADDEWQPSRTDVPRSPFDEAKAPSPSATAPARAAPLLLCPPVGSNPALVMAGSGPPGRTWKPTTERTLPAGGRFFAGDDGSIAYLARVPKEGGVAGDEAVVFFRTASATWQKIPVEAALRAPADVPPADAPPADVPSSPSAPAASSASPSSPDDLQLVRPIATREGVLLLAEATRTKSLVLVDVARAAMTELVEADLTAAERTTVRQIVADRAVPIDRTVSVTPQGALLARAPNGRGVEVSAEGVVSLSGSQFEEARMAGAQGLARSGTHLYATADHGHTWSEVQPPLGPFALQACSAAGCSLGAHVRLGWKLTPPSPPVPLAPIAPSPVVAVSPMPTLRCLSAGPPVRRSASVPPERAALGAHALASKGEDLEAVGCQRFGGACLPGAEGLLTALVAGGPLARDPQTDNVVVSDRDARELWWIDPLRPGAAPRSDRLSLKALRASLARPGDEAFLAFEDLPAASGTHVFAPRFGAKDTSVSTLLLLETAGTHLFVDASERARLAWMGPQANEVAPMAAIGTTRPDELVVLGQDGELLSLRPPNATRLGSLPGEFGGSAPTTALAIAKDGSVLLVRSVSVGAPPSDDDPAVAIPLLDPSGRSLPVSMAGGRVLAAWSKLELGSSAACSADTDGLRAMLELPTPWLGLATFGDEPALAMRALVRWSATRVCLDAVELLDPSNSEVTVARFDASPAKGALAAERVVLERGSEVREPLRCELLAAAPSGAPAPARRDVEP